MQPYRELVASLGDFSLEKVLDDGNITLVLKVVDQTSDENVAVKILREMWHDSKQYTARFEREIYVLDTCRHPNLVNLRRHGSKDRVRFYVMDYINGADLYYTIDKFGVLGIERSISVVEGVAGAVSVMHENGIINRDLKPENIMLRNPGMEHEEAVLIDPGVAKLDLSRYKAQPKPYETAKGRVLGTPSYIPPEQIPPPGETEGLPADERGDIYSLTTTFYMALCGASLFMENEGEGQVAFLRRTKHEAAPEPREFNPKIPQLVSDFVMRNLSKDPSQRDQTMIEYIAGLEKLKRKAA